MTTMYRWFSRYAIAAMLVDGKQKIAHQLALFVHQHLFISPLLFVSAEIAWKPPIQVKSFNTEKMILYMVVLKWNSLDKFTFFEFIVSLKCCNFNFLWEYKNNFPGKRH